MEGEGPSVQTGGIGEEFSERVGRGLGTSWNRRGDGLKGGGRELRGDMGGSRGRHEWGILGSEARKALQIFVQNNDCSGRC